MFLITEKQMYLNEMQVNDNKCTWCVKFSNVMTKSMHLNEYLNESKCN